MGTHGQAESHVVRISFPAGDDIRRRHGSSRHRRDGEGRNAVLPRATPGPRPFSSTRSPSRASRAFAGARRAAVAPAAPPPAAAPLVTTNAGGDIGYHANSTSTATKTNTPLRDIPQAVTVITKQQVQDIGAQRIEDVVRYVPGRQLAPGRRQSRSARHSRAEFDRRFLRQRHARRRADLSRPLQHRAARIPQGPERDDLRPRRRRRRAEPRSQGGGWRSDQRVEGPDRVLQQCPRVRRRRRQDHRQPLRAHQRRVRGHRQLSRLLAHAARRRQSDADVAGHAAHQGEAVLRIFP